ncbi:RNA polymerase sigma-70 factor [Belliella marina]|uniref:RNA polymerase sigma-70 factor n=1 Tax=Belliella marina TaxID=1644146 RepID=A0ABW4VM63_9BACT
MVDDNPLEAELMRRLQCGEESAFESIYNQYWDRLYMYAYRRVIPTDIAFELTQEIFISLWERREDLQLHTSLSGYLFHAMRNQIFKYIRHSQVRSQYAESFKQYYSTSKDHGTEDTLMLNDLEEAIERSVQGLPARCQEIFRMSRQQHLTITEIAEHLEISKRTVENQLHKALKHLRMELGDFMAAIVFYGLLVF